MGGLKEGGSGMVMGLEAGVFRLTWRVVCCVPGGLAGAVQQSTGERNVWLKIHFNSAGAIQVEFGG